MICNNNNNNTTTQQLKYNNDTKNNNLLLLKCEHRACNCTQYKINDSHSINNKRICDSCKHSWVIHAISKMGCRSLLYTETEAIDLESIKDIISLMLYAAQAIPIRLKILLDRLIVNISQDDFNKLLSQHGWSLQDYSRGYIMTKSPEHLNKWILATKEEEAIIIQQFLRFIETRQIAQQFLLDFTEMPSLKAPTNNNNKISPKTQIVKQELPSPKSSSSSQSDFRTDTSSPATNKSQNQALNLPPAMAAAAAALGYPPTMLPFMFAATNRNLLNDLHHPTSTPPGLDMNNFPYFPFAAAAAARNNPAAMAAFYNPTHLNPEFWLKNMQQHQQQQQQQMLQNAELKHENDVNNKHIKENAQVLKNVKPEPKQPKVIKPKKIKNEEIQVQPQSVPSTLESDAEATPNFSIENNDTNASFSSQISNQNTNNSSSSKRRRPDLSQQGILVSPNGKKRVQCHVCLKTFCDKGALKIHFSAVHLREMHKCTVEGCNMVFSSRRSRNRHSANPNPKLHMSRPHPISHRYPTTGPIISDERPSMAGAFLADVDKIQKKIPIDLNQSNNNNNNNVSSNNTLANINEDDDDDDDESMMSHDLESNHSESPRIEHDQQAQLKSNKRKSANPMRISSTNNVQAEKRKYSNNDDNDDEYDDQANYHNGNNESLQKRSKYSSSHSSTYSQSSSRSSSPQQNEQPLNFSMNKHQQQHQEKQIDQAINEYNDQQSDEDYDEVQSEDDYSVNNDDQPAQSNYTQYCSNNQQNQISTSS